MKVKCSISDAKNKCAFEIPTRIIQTLTNYRQDTLNNKCGQVIPPNQCASNLCFHNLYRTFDGSCNNFLDSTKGAAFTPYIRLLPANYADGIGEMIKAVNPRYISKQLLSSGKTVPSKASSLFMQWGQFISHDMAHSTIHIISCMCEYSDICSPLFFDDSDSRSNEFCMDFIRSVYKCSNKTEPRIQMNEATSFLDASMVISFFPLKIYESI